MPRDQGNQGISPLYQRVIVLLVSTELVLSYYLVST
jgi:hypothetical protein